MNEETKIVILDADNHREIIGLLTVKNKSTEEISKIINEVKTETDTWTWNGIIKELVIRGINFTWEKVHSIVI